MQAMRHWYNDMKDKLWGQYGFYDAFSQTANWFPERYLAIDQGPYCCYDGELSQWVVMEVVYELSRSKSRVEKTGFYQSVF